MDTSVDTVVLVSTGTAAEAASKGAGVPSVHSGPVASADPDSVPARGGPEAGADLAGGPGAVTCGPRSWLC